MMNKGVAFGPVGIIMEMLVANENLIVEWSTTLCNLTVAEESIPDEWNYNVFLPVFKEKTDPMEYGSCGAYKLLEHLMKVTGPVWKKVQGESNSWYAIWI